MSVRGKPPNDNGGLLCAIKASQNLSVISTLFDMFLLCGHGALMEELMYQIHPFNIMAQS